MTKQPRVHRARRRPSMRDVAEAAGVSQTTVSLVLNDAANSGIPDNTKARVRAAADEVGYRTNRLARAMRLDRTETLGFVSENIATTPFATRMIKGAQDAAWEAGHLLLIFDTGAITSPNHSERERLAVEQLLERQVDGIVIASMYHRVIEPPAALSEVPAVLVDLRAANGLVTSVVPDEHRAAYDATRHLIERGHTRIAHPTIDYPGAVAAAARLDGYRAALRDHAIADDPALVITEPSDTPGGRTAARRLLSLDDPPTAIFCYNDQSAMGVYQHAAERGLQSPGDLSVVGFDDQELIAAELVPGLTTMALPHYEMGYWAVEHLLGIDSHPEPIQHTIPCRLVERSSVAPPRPGP
ncbi:MAG: LacI family DNA-binding transcriptional regulator [Actinomycetota bacterium]